jgi:hypothetical protein
MSAFTARLPKVHQFPRSIGLSTVAVWSARHGAVDLRARFDCDVVIGRQHVAVHGSRDDDGFSA